MLRRLPGATFALATAFALPAAAQTAPATTPDLRVNLQPVDVTGQQGLAQNDAAVPFSNSVPANIPAVMETRTAEQIAEQVNALTVAEMLKYFPSIEVRERYIGDRNGIIATRTTGTVSSAESLVYADDMLLSNLLGNSYSYPPRWGLVPEGEIQRIDVMYGPFSALYPGNSMGGVVTITTRMPDKPEAHVDVMGALEGFRLYGSKEDNNSGHFSATAGDRIGPWSFWLNADHLDAQGHPMSFSTANLSTTAAKPADTVVTGAYLDNDQNGNPRYVFGAYSIDHTVQDAGNVKVAYDFSPTARLYASLGLWTNNSATAAQTYLTDPNGSPVYNGTVNIGGKEYKVSSTDPGLAWEEHLAGAVGFKTDSKGEWDTDISYTNYTYLTDWSRSVASYGTSTAGSETRMNGTGWQTADARGIWRPPADLLGRHEISFGAHYDEYKLVQYGFNNTVWQQSSGGAPTSDSRGITQTSALYLQDFWSFLPRWHLTLGGREEFWNALDGSNLNSKGTLDYPNRSRQDFSPKASLAYDVTQDFTLRASVGQAYRYPTVTELFQAVSNSQSVLINDPNLKPEAVVSYDVSGIYTRSNAVVRLSLFDEERHDALYSQTDTTVTPNVTQYENVGFVRSQGVEAAFDTTDLFWQGLELSGSVTYAHAVTMQDAQYPAAVGKIYPRVPDWRARLVATYHPAEDWDLALGFRYAGRAYNSLNNADINPNTYGGISSYAVVDARVTHRIGNGISVIAGVDNLGDCKYYVSPHPYPQTTGFLELKWDL